MKIQSLCQDSVFCGLMQPLVTLAPTCHFRYVLVSVRRSYVLSNVRRLRQRREAYNGWQTCFCMTRVLRFPGRFRVRICLLFYLPGWLRMNSVMKSLLCYVVGRTNGSCLLTSSIGIFSLSKKLTIRLPWTSDFTSILFRIFFRSKCSLLDGGKNRFFLYALAAVKRRWIALACISYGDLKMHHLSASH